MEETDDRKIILDLLMTKIDFIKNPVTASSFGGVWDRQIRSIRIVMNGLIKEHVIVKTKNC